MWWSNHRPTVARFAGLGLTLALAILLTGCFQPLYGERTVVGGPGLGERMKSVQVRPINVPNGSPTARVATELRNDLIFDLVGGSEGLPVTHELTINLVT